MDLQVERYRPRAFRFLGLWVVGDWRLKAYGIAHAAERPGAALVAAARRAAEDRLERTAAATRHHGVGFVGIHAGRTGNLVFVDWWADGNELHHHVYVSPRDDPGALARAAPQGPAACVWDLHLLHHEREAWVRAVLGREGGPDLEAYLAQRFEGDH